MKIQVTLEFNSPEEAIVALGKYVKDAPAPARSGTDAAASTGTRVPPAAAGTPKRGPGRPKKAVEPVKSSPVEAPQAAQAPAPAAPTQSGAPATPTEQDVIAALQACLNAVGMTKTRACFARHGVTRGAEVKPEDRAKFIEYVGKVAKKEIDPEAGAQ